jgi:ABC-2 type transport system ATP-binding protein
MQIDIEHLNKIYRGGVHAITDLDLTIPNGMFGLLDPTARARLP